MTNRTPHPLYSEAYIYKQPKSKNWTMDYKDQSGRRVRKSSKTQDKREALKRLGENITLIERVKTGEITLNNEKSINVKRTVKETIIFIEKKKPQKPVYINYIRELNKFADEYGDYKIEKINRKILREYFSQGFTRSVLDNIKTALRTMFILCEDNNYIDRSPEFPKNIDTKKSAKRKGMSEEQVQKMIQRFYLKSTSEKIEGKRRTSTLEEMENARIIYILIMLLYHTGARIGELRYIKPSDLCQRKISKRQRTYLDIKFSKTLAREVLIPINLFATLTTHIEKENIKPNDYIFKNRSTGKIPNNFTRIVQRDIKHNQDFYKDLGIENFCLYRLRHTFISERLSRGKDIFLLAKHCGTSVSTIEKNYFDYIVASCYTNVYDEQTTLFDG